MNRDVSPSRPRRFSMLRSFHLADLFTLANGAAGTAAILVAMSYMASADEWRIYLALGLLPLALVLDVLDGKIARGRQNHSLFGQELDSLADVVSFGIAPAALAYALGMTGGWDVVVLIFFAVCGISRLARYNTTALQLSDAAGKVGYFEGAPIPSSVLLVVVLGVCFYLGRTGGDLPFGVVRIASLEWHPLSLLYFASGCAMISKTLRIPKP